MTAALVAGPVLAQVGSPDAPATAGSTPGPSASASSSGAPSGSSSAYAPIVLSPGVSAVAPALKGTERPPPSVSAPPEEPRSWYGWQLLAADVVVVGTSVVLLRTQDEDSHLALFLGGSALYLGTGPLLHLLNRNGGNAVSSLIVRGSAILGGAAFGAVVLEGFSGCTERSVCKLSTVDYASIGAGVGVVIGTVVDATWLGWKPAPASAPASGVSALRPDVRIGKGGATFGVAFAF